MESQVGWDYSFFLSQQGGLSPTSYIGPPRGEAGFLGEADTFISTKSSSSTEGPPFVVGAISALSGPQIVLRGTFRP